MLLIRGEGRYWHGRLTSLPWRTGNPGHAIAFLRLPVSSAGFIGKVNPQNKFARRSNENCLANHHSHSGLLLGAWAVAGAQDQANQSASPQADNTKVNQRDQNPNEPTADQQPSNQSDMQITQQLRKAIIADKSLSTYGHNVKVIAQDGMVTLKGPVRSDEEKNAVEAKAAQIAGKDKVTSQLEVKPKQ